MIITRIFFIPLFAITGVEAEYELKLIEEDLDYPVYLTNDGTSGNIYIVEQSGAIKLVNKETNEKKVFINIKEKVYYVKRSELGLLCVAFPPDYERSKIFYVYYSTVIGRELYTVVESYSHKDNNKSLGILLKIKQPYSNHNGGQILFDKKGYLYIGVGDGGAQGDPFNNAQNLDSMLGKILRIDVSGWSGRKIYKIPADNPFNGRNGLKSEVYAYGLRNPWRFSIDLVTGYMICGDVGQWRQEEIDMIEKGGNYGWKIFEGNLKYSDSKNEIEHNKPLHVYGRGEGQSVTGGYVYRGKDLPGLQGAYIYGDYESRAIWTLKFNPETKQFIENTKLMDAPDRISSFGVDRNNELYVLGHRRGVVYKLVNSSK